MPTIQTQHLTGAALDWAVATAGQEWKTAHKHFPTMTLDPTFCGIARVARDGIVHLVPNNPMRQDPQPYNPSTFWVLGGEIIERERIQLYTAGDEWMAKVNCLANNLGTGQTPLIAAMRAYVRSRLGPTVDVPEELAQ